MKLSMNALLMGVMALAMVGPMAVRGEASFEKEEGVIVLDDSNFDDAIAQYDPLLVEFYAPWCGHCKALAPEYAKAAATLEKEGLSIAKLDATANRKMAEKYGIQGFPTLKFFRGGKATEYGGGRTADSIVSWVMKKSGPSAVTVDSVEGLEKHLEGNDVVAVGAFESKDSDATKAFQTVADRVDDVKFVMSFDDAVRKHLGLEKEGVVVHKEFETEKSKRTFERSLADSSELESFVNTHSLPTVVPFSDKLASRIFKGHINQHFLLFVDSDAEGSEKILDAYANVAEERLGKQLFITVDPSENRIMEFFGIGEEDLPHAVLVSMPQDGAMKKYFYPSSDEGERDFSEDALRAFLKDFDEGNVQPTLKSAPIPEAGEDYDGNVKVVVGKSFNDVVLDPEKDVLLEFYAPWCGHCKNLAPEYAKAADELSDVDSLVLAKIDATANEVDYPGVNVRGFPTMYFFPAGEDKTPQSYDAGRTADAIVKYVTENAAKKFDLKESDDGKEEL